MLRKQWLLILSLTSLALAVAPSVHAQDRVNIRLAEEKVETKEIELPSYWIGVALRDTDPALLAHLKLEHGVLVGDVIADSPAAKAGLQPLDVITRANEADIKSGEDLLKAVGAAKDSELTLTVYREARQQTVKVTPARRPEDQVAPHPPRAAEGHPKEAVEQALRLWKERAGPLEFDLVGPGVVTRVEPAPLPDDMKVIVEKEGKNPPKVTVKQGENSWGATAKEIDTLPEVARPHARMMLGMPADRMYAFTEPVAKPRPWIRHRVEPRDQREDPLSRIEEELKRLRQDVEDLRKRSQ